VIAPALDVEKVRKDFPALERIVHADRPLVYLDNAATSQKPRQVLDALDDYYTRHNANVHRGIHVLAEEATALYEGAREKVARFVNAADTAEIVFTKNSTESLNLVANVLGYADGRRALGQGDEVVITEMEHHSNIVPWQLLTQRTGATLRWFGLTDDGRLDLSDDVITERTKVVAFVHQSNLLGTVNDVADVVRRAKAVGALTLVDAAQSVPNQPVDVTALGVDFLAFTGHKLLGPTGVGVLWGRGELLEAMPPFLGGGSMIEIVTMSGSTYAPPPERFEAGTPVISQAIGLAAACDYLSAVGLDRIAAHEAALTARLLEGLRRIDGVRIIGPDSTELRGSAVSFVVAGVHPHDVGQTLDDIGIAVRVGHHCAAPVCSRYGVPATTRASSYLYNTPAEIDALLDGIEHVKSFWGNG
jgi:cysteine desulfurase/selenocysteine lyase